MNSIAKYMRYNLRKHYKLEITTVFLCLAFFVGVLALLFSQFEVIFITKYNSARYKNISITTTLDSNQIYKDFGIEDKKIGSFYDAYSLTAGRKDISVMDKSFFEVFDISYDRKTLKKYDFEIIAAYKFKDNYQIGSEQEFYVLGKPMKGVVVGYTYEKFILDPPYGDLATFWSSTAEYMVVVSDISLVEEKLGEYSNSYYSMYDLDVNEIETIKSTVRASDYDEYLFNYPFTNIQEKVSGFTNGSVQSVFVYIMVFIIFSAIIIYSINFLLFNEVLKKETAILCIIGVTKKTMIIANAILGIAESLITIMIYLLVYNLAIKNQYLYGFSAANKLIIFIVLGYVAIFLYRAYNISKNKILVNLSAESDYR
ncbi:MAG: hypothetical protein RR357_01880 [Clostridia bacterium]